jgi:inner membrane protein
MTEESLSQMVASIRQAPTVRLIALAGLTLLLQVPILLISGLITERQARRDAAVVEVSSKWGLTQIIAGPALIVPYAHTRTEIGTKGEKLIRTEERHAVVLPARLRAVANVDADVRHRGIFAVPIYTAKVRLDGEFARPGGTELGIDPNAILWPRARLAIGIADVRAIGESAVIHINDTPVAFQPGTGGVAEIPTGIHAGLPAGTNTAPIRFSMPLTLKGSVGLFFAPFGEETTVELTSDSPHPNFQGNWLPVERTVSADGFKARWTISSLSRNYPQSWLNTTDMRRPVTESAFGVELTDPVDEHRMAGRSVKYAGLFILLTFAAVWLIEVLATVRVHPIQYLLLGAALCLFYLLELSLAEHLTFVPAYVLASGGIVGLITLYGVAVFGKARRAGVVSAGVAGLYGYLFVLLTNEDYALLVGSLGLFVILAAIMLVTRRIDWYRTGRAAVESEQL